MAPVDAEQPLLQPSPFTDGLAQAPGRSSLLLAAWHNGNVVISVAALVCSTIALFIKQLHGSVPSVQITLISSLIRCEARRCSQMRTHHTRPPFLAAAGIAAGC